MTSFSSVRATRRRVALRPFLLLAVPFAFACTDAETVQSADSTGVALSGAASVPHKAPGENAVAVSASVPTVATATADQGASVTKEQFATLRAMQGNWAGDKEGKTPFFQTFEFASDSLITMITYADANFAVTSEVGAIVRTNNHVVYGPPTSSWVVTKWDGKHIEFTPMKGAASAFTWDIVSDDTIRVTRIWSENGKDQKKTIVMQRRAK